MGYYSYFRFVLIPTKSGHEQDIMEKEINETFNLQLEELNKWYTFEEDMIEFSKKYPNHIFDFTVEGEDRDDTWKIRFKDGSKELILPIVTWPEFNVITLDENKQIQEQTDGEVPIGTGENSSGTAEN